MAEPGFVPIPFPTWQESAKSTNTKVIVEPHRSPRNGNFWNRRDYRTGFSIGIARDYYETHNLSLVHFGLGKPLEVIVSESTKDDLVTARIKITNFMGVGKIPSRILLRSISHGDWRADVVHSRTIGATLEITVRFRVKRKEHELFVIGQKVQMTAYEAMPQLPITLRRLNAVNWVTRPLEPGQKDYDVQQIILGTGLNIPDIQSLLDRCCDDVKRKDALTYHDATTLDDSQQRAVGHAIVSPSLLSLVQGGSRSGKSFTLSVIATIAALLGSVVLVCGWSNDHVAALMDMLIDENESVQRCTKKSGDYDIIYVPHINTTLNDLLATQDEHDPLSRFHHWHRILCLYRSEAEGSQGPRRQKRSQRMVEMVRQNLIWMVFDPKRKRDLHEPG